jgi:hypothetical protein
LKGIVRCINSYMKNKNIQSTLEPYSINEQIKVFISEFPELVNEKYRNKVNYIDFNLVNSTLNVISGGVNKNYYDKYMKYKSKYLELQKKI